MSVVSAGLDFHEDLHRIGAKEGLKGRKLQKAMESYAWNITVLKVSVYTTWSLHLCTCVPLYLTVPQSPSPRGWIWWSWLSIQLVERHVCWGFKLIMQDCHKIFISIMLIFETYTLSWTLLLSLCMERNYSLLYILLVTGGSLNLTLI